MLNEITCNLKKKRVRGVRMVLAEHYKTVPK